MNKSRKSEQTKVKGVKKIEMKKANSGITLIALVVTIIVLLILARSSNSNANRRQLNIRKSTINTCI